MPDNPPDPTVRDVEWAATFVGVLADPALPYARAGIDFLTKKLAEVREEGRAEVLRLGSEPATQAPPDQGALAQIKRMQDFISEMRLWAVYLRWVWGINSEIH